MTDQSGSTVTTADMPIETLQAVVELQRTELNRLLREQTRLNDRIDSLLQLHEREQVLRQQMQASLDRLVSVQSGSAYRQQAVLTHGDATEADELRTRLKHTEDRFTALQGAVGDLIVYIERKFPSFDGADSGSGFIKVFAPS